MNSTETIVTDKGQRATTRHCISVSGAPFRDLRDYAARRGITMGRAIGQLLADAADLA